MIMIIFCYMIKYKRKFIKNQKNGEKYAKIKEKYEKKWKFFKWRLN